MLADIRYALRGFRRSPGFAFVAVISLALGIGANTGIFSLVNVVLLRTLPVRNPEELVVFTISTADRFGGSAIGQEQYRHISDKNTVLQGFAAFTGDPMTVSGNGNAEYTVGQRVSANFFETLGVSALIGRVFSPRDDRIPEGPPVCVISYRLWQRRFGGDPSSIRGDIQINGKPVTVLGVIPSGFNVFDRGAQTDVIMPLNSADSSGLLTFGRLKPGVSVAQAQAQLDVLYHQVQPHGRRSNRLSESRIVLRPGNQGVGRLRIQYKRPLLMLLAVVGLVLLIACANIGNLLMARASGRERETAIRLALGAGRARLVRQLLAESLVLTNSGAALGMVLAYAGKSISTQELVQVFAEELPRPLWYENRRHLDWFLEGWIEGTAIPQLEAREIRITEKTGVTTVTGVIVQKDVPDDLVTAVPVYGAMAGNALVFLGEVLADGRQTGFRLTAPNGVRKIVLDPKQTILTAPK